MVFVFGGINSDFWYQIKSKKDNVMIITNPSLKQNKFEPSKEANPIMYISGWHPV